MAGAAMLRYPGGGGSVPRFTPGRQIDCAWDETGRNIEFTDVFGIRQDNGASFVGCDDQNNSFMFAIPTPCRREASALSWL